MNDVQFIRSRDCIAGVLVLCRMSLASFITSPRCGVCLWSPFTIMSVPGVFGSDYTATKSRVARSNVVLVQLLSWDMGAAPGPTLPLSWISPPVEATCSFSESK